MEERTSRSILDATVPEVRGHNDQHPTSPFRPSLRDDQTSFNRLSKPDFICQQRTLGEWGCKSEKRRIDLMWVKVDLGSSDSAGNPLGAVGGAPSSEIVGKIFGLIIRRSHGRYSSVRLHRYGRERVFDRCSCPGDVIRTPPRTSRRKGLCRRGPKLCTCFVQFRALEKMGRRENVWRYCDTSVVQSHSRRKPLILNFISAFGLAGE